MRVILHQIFTFKENSMKSFDFDIFFSLVAFIIFFAMIFGFAAYSDTQKAECRKAAIEKNMTAIEIQGVCK